MNNAPPAAANERLYSNFLCIGSLIVVGIYLFIVNFLAQNPANTNIIDLIFYASTAILFAVSYFLDYFMKQDSFIFGKKFYYKLTVNCFILAFTVIYTLAYSYVLNIKYVGPLDFLQVAIIYTFVFLVSFGMDAIFENFARKANITFIEALRNKHPFAIIKLILQALTLILYIIIFYVVLRLYR